MTSDALIVPEREIILWDSHTGHERMKINFGVQNFFVIHSRHHRKSANHQIAQGCLKGRKRLRAVARTEDAYDEWNPSNDDFEKRVVLTICASVWR
ncbi:hypothetical protein TNCV_3562321 [Trichonephila clavipes]|nr:hypothetical protein TNCV_3562321 [Trichonephila clavipes]